MEQLKKTIFEILSQYLDLKRVGKEYRTKCIFHSEYRPSLYINLDKMVYHCFGCGKKGSVLNLLKELTGREISEVIFDEFLSEKTHQKNDECKEVMSVNIDKFKKITEKDIVYLDYLKSRKLDMRDVEKFDLRKGCLDMEGRIVIPVKEKNKCVGYVGRAVFSGAPKWKYMTGFKPTNYLFNLDNVRDEIVLVEGIFDVMRLEKEGISAVALFGKKMSDIQLEKLIEKEVKKVYICLDSDVADIELATIYHKLSGWINEVRVLRLRGDKDPDELGKDIFKYEVDFEFSL